MAARNNASISLPVSRRWGESKSWMADIRTKQQEHVTPEIRKKQQLRAERSKRIGKRKKRAQVYQKAAVLSKNAWGQGASRALRSAPQDRMRSAEVSNCQMRSIQHVYQNRNYVDSDDEEEVELQMAKVEAVQTEDVIQVNEKEMGKLLRELRAEPKEESDQVSKFKLYEEFLKTVEESRKATFEFWKDTKEEFTQTAGQGNAVKQVEKDLKDLDHEDNLAIQWSESRWFVYDMMVKADSNNDKIQKLMKTVETKLDLLQQEDNDCPFCLEPLKEKECHTLGCCHQTCSECWDHWKNFKGSQAFCPLCRQEDFLTDMV